MLIRGLRLLVAISLVLGASHLTARTEIAAHKVVGITIDLPMSDEADITYLQFDERFGGIARLGEDRLLHFDRTGRVTLDRRFSTVEDHLNTRDYLGATFLPNGAVLILFVNSHGYHVDIVVRIVTENGKQLDKAATAQALCGKDYNSFNPHGDRNFRVRRVSAGDSYSGILQAGIDDVCDLKSRTSLSDQIPSIPGYGRVLTANGEGELTAAFIKRTNFFRRGTSGTIGDNIYLQSATDKKPIGPLASPFTFHRIAEYRIFPDYSLIGGRARVDDSRGWDAFLLVLETASSRKIFARYADFGSQDDEIIFLSRQGDAIAILVATGFERRDEYWFACFNMRGDETGRLAIDRLLSKGNMWIGSQENGHVFVGYKSAGRYNVDVYRMDCP
ncbi:MAG: hypothetical protein OXJ64_05150 [Boseongicola sp.]|nr:hypothetical protein [Boseongicola sp.]